jgi:hypothetical protein
MRKLPKLKVHFDGWMALPAAFLRKLEVTKDDEFAAEFVGNS